MRIVKYIASRYFFLLAFIYFIYCLFHIQSQTNSAQSLVSNADKYAGVIIEYPVPVRIQQRVTVLNEINQLRMFIYLPREEQIEKGGYIECEGNGVVADNQYAQSKNVHLSIYYCKDIKITKGNNSIQSFINSARGFIEKICRENLPEPQASLLLGMLIGSNEAFTVDFENSLLLSGTSHIIAVSGYNVNFVTGLLLLLSRFINKNRLMLIIIPLLLLYLIIVGVENIPALRAIFMNIYLLFGQMLGAKRDFLNSMGLSLLLILIINPFAVLSVSLYLSFLAVISQNILSPFVSKYIKYDSLRTSLVCIVGTLPLTVILFQVFFPWSLPINVIIAPLLPIIMELVLITFPLILIFPQLANVLIFPLRSVFKVLVDIIYFAEKLPLNRIESHDLYLFAIPIFLVVVFVIYKRRSK